MQDARAVVVSSLSCICRFQEEKHGDATNKRACRVEQQLQARIAGALVYFGNNARTKRGSEFVRLFIRYS